MTSHPRNVSGSLGTRTRPCSIRPRPQSLSPPSGPRTGYARRIAITAAALGLQHEATAIGFARFMVALAVAQGDRARLVELGSTCIIFCDDWSLMKDVRDLHPAAFAAWNSLLEGALMAHNRHLALRVMQRLDLGDPAFEWHIVERRSDRPARESGM